MKKLIIISVILSFGLSGCKKEEVSGDAIVGKWKLEEYCKPEGENSCKEVTVPKSKSVIIEFSKSGSFNEVYDNTIPVEYGFMGCGPGTFTHDDEAVYLQLMCMSSTYPKKVPILKHTEKELILKPFTNGEYRFRKL